MEGLLDHADAFGLGDHALSTFQLIGATALHRGGGTAAVQGRRDSQICGIEFDTRHQHRPSGDEIFVRLAHAELRR